MVLELVRLLFLSYLEILKVTKANFKRKEFPVNPRFIRFSPPCFWGYVDPRNRCFIHGLGYIILMLFNIYNSNQIFSEMAIYTSSELKKIAKSSRYFTEDKKPPLFAGTSKEFDIFLSHCFLDEEEVKGLYLELSKLGYSVYVDWIIDPQLDRKKVTKQSAKLIKQRLKASKTLLLAMSAKALLSRWIPWELGFVDANTGRCAIVPVSKEKSGAEDFKGWEFLTLYPYLNKKALTKGAKRSLWVVESKNTYSPFNEWFDSGKLKTHRKTNIL